MKTKIIYTIVFLMIAKLAYSQEEQYSADKFVAKCPNEIFIGAILEANSINQDTYKFLKISMNPINMGYTIPIKSQTITPSYNNMMKAIHEALKTNDVLKSNYSFSFVIKKIKSYQELAVWGAAYYSIVDMESEHSVRRKSQKLCLQVQRSVQPVGEYAALGCRVVGAAAELSAKRRGFRGHVSEAVYAAAGFGTFGAFSLLCSGGFV